MSTTTMEDLLAPSAEAKAQQVMASNPAVLEVNYRLGDFGDHQRVEVLVVVKDRTPVDREFRHSVERGFAALARGPQFEVLDVPSWPLLRLAKVPERDEILGAAG